MDSEPHNKRLVLSAVWCLDTDLGVYFRSKIILEEMF